MGVAFDKSSVQKQKKKVQAKQSARDDSSSPGESVSRSSPSSSFFPLLLLDRKKSFPRPKGAPPLSLQPFNHASKFVLAH
jgi:hypothetical protein